MKQLRLIFLFVVLMSMFGAKVFAYDYAFKNEDGVTIYYNSLWPNLYDAEVTYSDKTKYSGIINIPQSINYGMTVVAIGNKAFFECTGLTKAIMPNSVNTIDDYSFYGCTGLSSITLPENVWNISNYAFANCTGITSLLFPKNVKMIGSHAFYGCTGLTKITIPNSVNYIGANAFDVNDSPTLESIISLIENPFDIYGKTSYDGKEYIGAFSQSTFENAILYVPKGTIDKYKATEGWKDFAHIEEGTGENVNPINSEIFVNGINYRVISDTECEVIHRDDYSGDVVIPETITSNGQELIVTSIEKEAFRRTNIVSLTIPNSVTSIGEKVFFSCFSLTSIIVSQSINNIPDAAFMGCNKLSSIDIPDGVTSIGCQAFEGCTTMSTITIPKSVTSIGNSAFYDTNLLIVISNVQTPFNIKGKNMSWQMTFSEKTFNNAILYVPKGTIDKYKATEGWKDFAHIEENNDDTGIEKLTSKDNVKDIQSLRGIKVQSPSKGINIIKMKDGTVKKVLVK